MSLIQVAMDHRTLEGMDAMRAVRELQVGDKRAARWAMEVAAMHRHLAYEAMNTDNIAAEARADMLRLGRAA